MRIFSITSGVCTQGSLPSAAVERPTYSGRGIDFGTGRSGETTPELRGLRTSVSPHCQSRDAADGPRLSGGRLGPRMLTEPITTRPVSTTCGLPSLGGSLRRSRALPP